MGRLCIGFFPIGGTEWMGGRNILRYMLASLRALPDTERPETVLLVTDKQEPDLACLVDRTLTVDWEASTLWGRVSGRLQKESHLSRFLRDQQIDAVFCPATFDEYFRTPVLSYIPDFQHFRLPEMFSAEEIAARDKTFRAIAERATQVILTSRSTLEDYQEFAPEYAQKGAFLPVAAQVFVHAPQEDPRWVCDKYHLPERYFYLPNQFWKHKNHLAVIRALAMLKTACPDMTVVCTGHPHDPRHPAFLSELLSEIAALGVHHQVRLLGLVPREDIQPLLRQSLAVLQPSLFEGWSATVEEARSLGKHLILSDMPIFREKDLPCAMFFDPHSIEELAVVLRKSWEQLSPGPNVELERRARADLEERMLANGRRFAEIVQECLLPK